MILRNQRLLMLHAQKNKKAVDLIKKTKMTTPDPKELAKSNAALCVERNAKWEWTTGACNGVHDSKSGEILVHYSSKAGDCGSVVFCNNAPVGMHVGTYGKDNGNCFIGGAALLNHLKQI